jgi:cytochrome c556
MVGRSLVTLGLFTTTIVGLAGAQPQVGSGDVVADRQRLMKLNGASVGDINAKLKAGQIEAIAVNAETIALNARHIPFLFPPGSVSDKSKAQATIWEKWEDFQAAAKNLEMQAEKLRDAARSKDADATEAGAKDFAKQTCGKCHTPQADGKIFGPLFRSLL